MSAVLAIEESEERKTREELHLLGASPFGFLLKSGDTFPLRSVHNGKRVGIRIQMNCLPDANSVLLNESVVELYHAVGAFGDRLVVGDHHNGQALLMLGGDEVEDLTSRGLI